MAVTVSAHDRTSLVTLIIEIPAIVAAALDVKLALQLVFFCAYTYCIEDKLLAHT